MFRRFLSDRRGNFASMMIAASVPLLVSVGLAVDLGRYMQAQEHMQNVADAASLALAAGRIEGNENMWAKARDVVHSNANPQAVNNLQVDEIDYGNERYDVRLKGHMRTTFMALAGYENLEINASSQSVRGVNGSVEVALVLDNTWSMSDLSNGVTKISALKIAAKDLVVKMIGDGKQPVTISVVPYADYVNVGTSNRSASWLSVPEDTSTTSARTCTKSTTKTSCLEYAPKATCERDVDGVRESYSCGGACVKSETKTVPEYETCSGGTTTTKTFFGCIGSRKSGKTRLDDLTPAERYPGFIDTSAKCPTEILPLTNNKKLLETSIDGLIVNRGTSYRPLTYIPSGLMWGINVLSPTAPFSDGKAYDSKNIKPRKVIILMTDGENTLRFNTSGTHTAPSGTDAQKNTQTAQTRSDTIALCDYAKSKKIEVFTVAFGVDVADAKTLLEGCATDPQHYFDAADSAALAQSFSNIVMALQNVRLTR